MNLLIKRLTPTAVVPRYHSPAAAGLDLHADLLGEGCRMTLTGGRLATMQRMHRIETGLAFEIPPGHVGIITGRSSLSARGLIAATGVVDADYRGPVSVMLWVMDGQHAIEHGDRIAQMLIIAAPQFAIVEAEQLSETARNTGGFGSSGR